MNKWKCPRCGEWFDSAVVAVDKKSRKNKRGRIAWLRDGICPKCAAKGETERDGEKPYL